jgi:hypothetical protein
MAGLTSNHHSKTTTLLVEIDKFIPDILNGRANHRSLIISWL